jgi:hypothetical protein
MDGLLIKPTQPSVAYMRTSCGAAFFVPTGAITFRRKFSLQISAKILAKNILKFSAEEKIGKTSFAQKCQGRQGSEK